MLLYVVFCCNLDVLTYVNCVLILTQYAHGFCHGGTMLNAFVLTERQLRMCDLVL